MNSLEYIDVFLEAITSEKNISYNTYHSYRSDLLGFCEFVDNNNLVLVDLDLRDLQDYVKFFICKRT
ncbi:MAG: site-specific integrase [Ehrlichia sp.]